MVREYLYLPLEPYQSGYLDVGQGHEIYYEQSGKADGIPIVFLHGGPGAGASPLHRRFFDPKVWRIVILDQRGCGRSRPNAEIRHNNPEALISDLEHLRSHLNIEKWHVFGGSWGSTLALAYAQSYSERVLGLILRGVFLMTPAEIDWYLNKMGMFRPEAWSEFTSILTEAEKLDIVNAYWQRLTSENEDIALEAARYWSKYESACARLILDHELIRFAEDPKQSLALARLECHFFRNHLFDPPDKLLQELDKIRHIPAVIVQGRYDLICPPVTADLLHQAWPEADYIIVEDAGHYALETGILLELIRAIKRFSVLKPYKNSPKMQGCEFGTK